MESSAKQKVPNGKLVIVKLRYSDSIEDIKILGDFFIYPESALNKIEAGLRKTKINSTVNEITDRISKIIKDNEIEMIGITPESIAQTIKIAVQR